MPADNLMTGNLVLHGVPLHEGATLKQCCLYLSVHLFTTMGQQLPIQQQGDSKVQG